MKKALSTYLTRPATLDDLKEIAALLNHVFGGQHHAAALRWKYTGCAGRLVGSTVLISNHKIVGFLGQIPVRVDMAGREILATQGADIAILEPYRRLDVFMTLIQACLRELEAAGVVLTYGTANASAALTLATFLGQQTVAVIPLLVLPLSRKASPSSKSGAIALTGILASCLRTVERCSAPGLKAASRDALRITRLDRFDERFDRFWQRTRNDYRILLVRDAAYLNWRYVNVPGVVYERLGLKNATSGEIEGYAVLSLTRRGDQVRGRFCDLVTPRQGDRQAVQTLISSSIKWFRAHAADIAEIWMLPGSHLRFPLRRQGFIPRRRKQNGFQASILSPGVTASLQGVDGAHNWFLSMGDSDTV